jgi:hypothetical protein
MFFSLSQLVSSQTHFQHVTFPVKVNGTQIASPFTGGLDAPQYAELDFDRNGQMELLVFDRIGNVPLTFLEANEPASFQYAPIFEAQLPPLSDWVRVYDYNGDGIEDIFTNNPVGSQGVAVYQGYLQNDKLRFTRLIFPQGNILHYKSSSGTWFNLFVAFTDVPAMNDIDQDGDMDILSFDPNGVYITFFENKSVQEGYGSDSLLFEVGDICWGKMLEDGESEEVVLSENANECAMAGLITADNRHAGSTMTVTDLSQNGLPDLLVGDIESTHVKALYNEGTLESAWFTYLIDPFPAEPINYPEFISTFLLDVDNDGIDDLITGINNRGHAENVNVSWYYKGHIGATNYFTLERQDFMTSSTLDFGSGSHPVFTDYNGDGLLDIVIGTYGKFRSGLTVEPGLILLENSGTSFNPAFTMVDRDWLGLGVLNDDGLHFRFAPAFGDLDDDGDQDMLLGESSGKLIYFENIAGQGNPFQFTDPVFHWMDIDVGSLSVPFIYDINQDGKMDIIVGEKTGSFVTGIGRCGNINYFENLGTTAIPIFNSDPSVSPNSDCWGHVLSYFQNANRGDASPIIVQAGNDLRLITGTNKGYFHYYDIDEDSNATFEKIDSTLGDVYPGIMSSSAVADIDGDGVFEMLTGNFRGGLTFYKTNWKTDGTVDITEVPTTSLNVFPNPTQEKLFIESSNPIAGYQIISIEGKIVSKKNIATKEIDVNELVTGMYLLSVNYSDGSTETAMFVKI